MNYRLIFIVVFSIIIGFVLAWFTKDKFTYNDNFKSKSEIKQLEKSKKTEIKLSELDSDCSKDIISLNPLIVKYAENATCNCDSVFTTLEINFCSGTKLCIEKNRFELLNRKLIVKYDSLVLEQAKESKILESFSDYNTIKKLHNESIKLFLKYVEVETEIEGIKIGDGRLRTSYENQRALNIFTKKNLELENLIDEVK